jgi:sugar lactone lactonase YvrE
MAFSQLRTAAKPVTDSRDELGESPIWHDSESALYWVDLRAPALYRLETASNRRTVWPMPELIGCFALTGAGAAIAGLKSGFSLFDLNRRTFEPIAAPESHLPKNRINDGRCDPAGRYWAGTMQDGGGPPAGSLYRIDAEGNCRQMQRDFITPNGFAWSPAGTTLYLADSGRDVILKYPFDIDDGVLGEPETFASTVDHPGKPDGATIDEDGCLWSAEYGGSRVVRYTPAGVIDRVIELPVTLVTSCTFGGADLDILYVTTARQRLGADDLARQPLAGAVFAARPGPRGMPERLYRTH